MAQTYALTRHLYVHYSISIDIFSNLRQLTSNQLTHNFGVLLCTIKTSRIPLKLLINFSFEL